MRTIYTVGETTYDIIFKKNRPSQGVVGGSALNTAVTLGRLGLPVHFISRLGNDKIGDLSINFLLNNRVNCNNIIRFRGNSRIAVAFTDDENDAEYQFYNASQSPALQFPEPSNEEIILFGSTNAIKDEGRKNLLLFLKKAYENRALTIYDPNIRETDTEKLKGIRQYFEENLKLTQILKGSEHDFYFLYKTYDSDEIFKLVSAYGVKALIITSGDKPIQLTTNEISKKYLPDPIKTINTIGAGDNFSAGMITGFWKHHVFTQNLEELSLTKWDEIIRLGIIFASEVCKIESNYIPVEIASYFSEQYLKN